MGNFHLFLDTLKITINCLQTLTFGKLANVQTVGIGLYLALVVIQAVSAGGLDGLKRRVTTLKTAVYAARLRNEYAKIRHIQSEVTRLEIRLQAINKTALCVISALFAISVIYFGACTIWQDLYPTTFCVISIFTFYLALPMLIFFGFAAIIHNHVKSTTAKIKTAETSFKAVNFGP